MGAVVREKKDHSRPINAGAPQPVLGIPLQDDLYHKLPGKCMQLLSGAFVEYPFVCSESVTDSNDQFAPRLEEIDQFPECPLSFIRMNMVPDSTHQDDVKFLVQFIDILQSGERIINPLNSRMGMLLLGF